MSARNTSGKPSSTDHGEPYDARSATDHQQSPGPTPESLIKSEILAKIGARKDVRVWNNPSGSGYTHKGSPIRWGLVGSADIIGIWCRRIPAPHDDEPGEDVGLDQHVGVFLAIEVKSAVGRQRPEQIAFQRMVEEYGGVYILARSVSDVTEVLDG